ncbi:DNA cytosine methyltransferase [Oscillatoria sp. HE19RPO]|uniref:DNA cytosine methyltransferase n=1 Tax=Oscillatoria sp. HE19RPO TaxID=2954806 RepID=UPI0020C4CA69|nr:DNA cytosine methyltransferase [Oscillatoria sp. HE19RPO]
MKKSHNIPYLDFLNTELKMPSHAPDQPLVLDLFAGCGGFALGFEAAGFRTIGYEMDPDACLTYRQNLNAPCHQVMLTPETELVQGAAVIIGGPPCQPFSVGGHQRGVKDSRDGFPVFINAVQQHRPAIVIFENVPGMRFRNKAYFEDIISRLKALDYIVEWEILTASDYGVPQRRQRLFCIAHQGGWRWPKPTHHYHPYTAGEALGELAFMAPPHAKFLTPSMDEYIRKYEKASKCVNPRDLHLDRPSRTVTCRNLSAPTGDMLRIRLPEGRRRRLTVQEGARLQSFPDGFEFQGSEESQCQQIGNAVPPILAKALAVRVKAYLENLGTVESEKCHQVEEPIQLSFNFIT